MNKILKNFVLIILILMLSSVIYSKYIRKDHITKIFGKGFLLVVTGSMSPTIETNNLIVISEQEEYKVGDIVTYLEEEALVTHRIIEINNDKFVTKGDNNNANDGEHDVCTIQGKVILSSKLLGLFVQYALKPLILVYIAFLIILELKTF